MKNTFLVLFALLIGFAAQAQAPAGLGTKKKVVLVIFENTSVTKALAQPFFKKFADMGLLLTNYHAITHPSQPNYFALVGGSTFNNTDDNNFSVDQTSIVDLLEAKHRTWRVYAEGFPGKCSSLGSAGAYARKHNPLISFTTVRKDAKRCANITAAGTFVSDFKDHKLADFVLYIPDEKNDGHDTGVAFADKWFAKTFEPLVTDPKLMENLYVIATFDEDDGSAKNKIYTAIVGPGISPGKQDGASYDHYDLLRTIEKILGLGDLGRNDSKRNPIAGF